MLFQIFVSSGSREQQVPMLQMGSQLPLILLKLLQLPPRQGKPNGSALLHS